MSEKEMMLAVLKAVIASATVVKGYPYDYLKGTFSFKEDNRDSLRCTITYYGENECKSPELFVKLPWLGFAFSHYIRDDKDLDKVLVSIEAACNAVNKRIYKQYFHRNLSAMCEMLNIKI